MHLWFEIGKKSNLRQLEWRAVSLELHELAMVSFRTFRCVSAWTEWERFACSGGDSHSLLLLHRQWCMTVALHCWLLGAWPLTLHLVTEQQLEQAGDVGEWRAVACKVLVIIWLSKRARHWFPSRFETSVQQSILLNFQGCQQDAQVCIKNQSAESIFHQEIEVSPFFSPIPSFFLFVFHMTKCILMTFTGQGVTSCYGEESELFSQVVLSFK